MRNSTVSVCSASNVSQIGAQVTYMTRSKRNLGTSQSSSVEVPESKKILNQRRGNHSSEGSSTETNAKVKLENDSQDQAIVNKCIPSKKSPQVPPGPDQSVQNVKVENSTVSTERTLRTRTKQNRTSKKKKRQVCDICHKAFNCREKFLKHKTRHDPNKPYGCEICGKYFDDARFVKTHRTLHEKKSRKECDICGKVFNERIFFDIHRLTHFEQKPFRCDICEDIFKDRTTFMRHRNNHKARVKKVAQRFLSMKEVLKQKLEDTK